MRTVITKPNYNSFICKAKDRNGLWINGFVCRTMPDTMLNNTTLSIESDRGIVEIDQTTICRPTNIKDKNGNSIYQWDICIVDDNKIGYVVYVEKDGCFCIKYDNSNNKPALDIVLFESSTIEVVGNVFDNSNFLIDKFIIEKDN